MNLYYSSLLVAAGVSFTSAACADHPEENKTKVADGITVSGGRPSALPIRIPATIEGITGTQVEQTINATDSEDALKYLPSLLVRKRYIGDHNHAVLSTRASGTGNSARTMVFADGILLSNFLGNGAAYTPRWGLVTPEEIERVDVLYGPFSAAYAGNSAGAVVEYLTRMPNQFEAHAKIGIALQDYSLYRTSERSFGKQGSASLGNKNGDWSWRFNVGRQDSSGQPLNTATRMLTDGVAPTGGTPVSGAIADSSPRQQDLWILGTAAQFHAIHDHAKLKLAYDISPSLQAAYTLGWWRNETRGSVDSYLRDAAGNSVYAGDVVIDGLQYNLNGPVAAFAPSLNRIEHTMQGLSVKSHTDSVFDWEVAASRYGYGTDVLRAPTGALPAAFAGGPGRITDLAGTGWGTLKLRGIWRPGSTGAHVVDFGFQQDNYRLRTLVSNSADWIQGTAGSRFSAFNGNTGLQSWYAQDSWRMAPAWNFTLGGRYEQWQAWGGQIGNAASLVAFGGERKERHFSPKAALSWRAGKEWTLKASGGRAVRMPTVGELYQGSISGNTIINTNPDLKPEKSWTTELSAERGTLAGVFRATLFFERTRDALYSQPLGPTVNTVQNIDRVRTNGLELSWQTSDLGVAGLELSSSLTYADSKIAANANFPGSVGKRQPRVPKWRATVVATYKPDATWVWTLAARYSGVQYGQLDNSDTNGYSYQGFSPFFVADLRLRYRMDRQWSASLGIDNLNNYRYWAFHPYPQRTVMAELKFDL